MIKCVSLGRASTLFLFPDLTHDVPSMLSSFQVMFIQIMKCVSFG